MTIDSKTERIFVSFRNSMQASHGAKATCELIGKKYPTMMREINPYDNTAKLGFIDAVEIIKLDTDGAIFKVLEEELGLKITVV